MLQPVNVVHETCINSVLHVYLFFFFLKVIMVIKATTSPYPDLHRHESEKFFTDPKKKDSKLPFPNMSDPPSIDLSVIVPAYNEEERCEFEVL